MNIKPFHNRKALLPIQKIFHIIAIIIVAVIIAYGLEKIMLAPFIILILAIVLMAIEIIGLAF